jgi:hypothetical protein
MDEHHRIHKRMPTDDWYGELLLKGWAFGFVVCCFTRFIYWLTIQHSVLLFMFIFAYVWKLISFSYYIIKFCQKKLLNTLGVVSNWWSFRSKGICQLYLHQIVHCYPIYQSVLKFVPFCSYHMFLNKHSCAVNQVNIARFVTAFLFSLISLEIYQKIMPNLQ